MDCNVNERGSVSWKCGARRAVRGRPESELISDVRC